MDIQLDIWLRGDNHATTAVIAPVPRGPREWTDADMVAVLEGMLRALERAKHPDATPDRPVVLKGFSWIVSPFEAAADPRDNGALTVGVSGFGRTLRCGQDADTSVSAGRRVHHSAVHGESRGGDP